MSGRRRVHPEEAWLRPEARGRGRREKMPARAAAAVTRHAAYFRYGACGRLAHRKHRSEAPSGGPGGSRPPSPAPPAGPPPPDAMTGQTQELVTFEDIALYLSRAEWDTIAAGKRELYRSVMLDNYKLLTSLGYPGPKPDILYRIERGEEPWVCTPQSPVRWDGPNSPSPGHNGDMSWLEEPPSDWSPGAGGRHVLEERMQTPCCGGRCVQWRLRSRRLLSKFRCLEGRSQLPAEVASRGAEAVESRNRARTVFWPGKEGEVEDKQVVKAKVTQSRRSSLHPVTKHRNKKADPREHLRGGPRKRFQRNAQNSRRILREVTFLQGNRKLSVRDLNETILKDHCYCVVSETQLLCCTSHPCPLREHDYCRNCQAGVLALKDHEYCHMQRIRYQGRANKIVHLTGKARAVLHRLAKRKSHVGQIIRKAKQIKCPHKPRVNKRVEFPRGGSTASCLSEPTVPPAKAEDDPTKGTCGAFCPPAKQETVPSQGGTSETLHAPVVCFEPTAAPPPSDAAVEVKREATHLKVYVHREMQRTQLIQSPDAKQNVGGHELVNSNYVSLHDAYKMVMWTVDHMLDSVCQNFELGGYFQCKDIWPIVIQIDS